MVMLYLAPVRTLTSLPTVSITAGYAAHLAIQPCCKAAPAYLATLNGVRMYLCAPCAEAYHQHGDLVVARLALKPVLTLVADLDAKKDYTSPVNGLLCYREPTRKLPTKVAFRALKANGTVPAGMTRHQARAQGLV